MLVGMPVEQVGRMVDGHPTCEYVVRGLPQAAPPAEKPRRGRKRGTA
jgi:hypothetical protein